MSEKVAQNVIDFLAVASGYCGRLAAEEFSGEMWGSFTENTERVDSPIEQIIFIALHIVAKINGIDLDDGDPQELEGGWDHGVGLHIHPQRAIGTYRVDFLCYYHQRTRKAGKWIALPDVEWVVECDGHDFHERNKAERAYEKRRDRYLTTHGYRLLRFTGSEIVADPFAVAAEVLKAVTACDIALTPVEYWGADG